MAITRHWVNTKVLGVFTISKNCQGTHTGAWISKTEALKKRLLSGSSDSLENQDWTTYPELEQTEPELHVYDIHVIN